MDFVSDLLDIPNLILTEIASKYPPWSAVFVVGIALCVSLGTTLLSKSMIDIEKLKKYTKETKEFQKLKMKAVRSQDRRLLKRVEDNESRFNAMQKELMTMRMRPMLYQFIPLIAVFAIMNGFFGSSDAIVAIMPFKLPDVLIFIPIADKGATTSIIRDFQPTWFIANYIGWYFFSSLTFGSLIQKIAGLTPD